jgi:hypothetical protein
VLVRAHDAAGAAHVALIEVKLSEDDFGDCSAFLADRNVRRHVCVQTGWFGGDPQACFQLSNHDRGQRRRYDEFLGGPGDTPGWPGCCFRMGANQVMRNVALARVLLARGEADTVTVALMAPEGHSHIWRRWTENHTLFVPDDKLRFASVPASAVLQFHSPDEAKELAARYLLG